ncbi:MAG: methyl-accepting chemotaxis protein [bacterium]|nr:methyl-accepting chemotaxis protein [bacterium]
MSLSGINNRQYTLGQKLAGGFGFTLLMLVLVAGFGIFEVGSIDHALRKQLIPQIKHEFRIFTVRADLIEAQLHLHQYFSSADKEVIEEGRKHVRQAIELTDQIISQTTEEDVVATYQQLNMLSSNILSELDETQRLTEEIGIDENSGLRAKMRTAAHQAEVTLAEHNLSEASGYLLDIYKSNRPGKALFDRLEQAIKKSDVASKDQGPLLNALNAAERRPTAANLTQLSRVFDQIHLPGAGALYLETRRNEKDFLIRFDRKYLQKHDQSLGKLEQVITRSGLNQQDKTKAIQALSDYNESFDALAELKLKVLEQNGHVQSLALTIDAMVEGISSDEKAETAEISESIDSQVNLSKILLWSVSILGLVGAVAFAIWFVRYLTRLLLDLAQNLNVSARQVAAASDEIAQSSQQLSEGATEQAASLEETSSSMEQMSSQTDQNAQSATRTAEEIQKIRDIVVQSAENTENAAGIAAQAKEAAEKGARAMSDILAAMDQINSSSHEITDIVEVINEITHQTKMLATNAAIEAARAGEQGKGFAVVADEVSKLAESSKSAAKDIGRLIKESGKRATAGHEQAQQGQQVLKEILERNSQVEELMEELAESARFQSRKMDKAAEEVMAINTASGEQANGIRQVSEAVVQMDKVTQSNAANAEETASASEELSAQAQMLHQLVADLALQVGAKLDHQQENRGPANPPSPRRSTRLEIQPSDLQRHHRAEPIKATPELPQQGSSKRIKPTEAIPMREDFSDF